MFFCQLPIKSTSVNQSPEVNACLFNHLMKIKASARPARAPPSKELESTTLYSSKTPTPQGGEDLRSLRENRSKSRFWGTGVGWTSRECSLPGKAQGFGGIMV